jgi:hypothetical protein
MGIMGLDWGSVLQCALARQSRLYCSGSMVLVGWFELQPVMTLMTTCLTWLRVAFDDRGPRHVSEMSCYIYMNPHPYIFHYFFPSFSLLIFAVSSR